jgi:hypothetical protein
MFDFDNLPESNSELDALINALSPEDVLMYINEGRSRIQDSTTETSEREYYAGILLARRMRTLRETKTRVTKATSPQKKALSYDDLY